MTGKKYFHALGQFYASGVAPLRPFMQWPQWARDAYLDGFFAGRHVAGIASEPPCCGGADCSECPR
jgi:hypothetical protein